MNENLSSISSNTSPYLIAVVALFAGLQIFTVVLFVLHRFEVRKDFQIVFSSIGANDRDLGRLSKTEELADRLETRADKLEHRVGNLEKFCNLTCNTSTS